MSYFGKVFKNDKDDNLEGFFKAIAVPEEHIAAILKAPSTETITKDGDTYNLNITGARNIVFKFKNGETVEDKIDDKFSTSSTFTVEGNVIIQHQKGSDGREITFRREFSDNSLTEKITVVGWNGVAHRHFKA